MVHRYPCERRSTGPDPSPLNRREMLRSAATGFGALAASALFGDSLFGKMALATNGAAPAPGGVAPPHHMPRARHVIFLYMDGGPSQLDTFDPKPRLRKDDGKPFPMPIERTQFDNNGAILGSPWSFSQHGDSGIEVSELFPHVARSVDDLCVVRSMTSPFSEHTNANYFLHTGLGLSGRPSMGAWASYGLGTASRDLPGFVVLNGGLVPPGGLECFGSGFLPATHQGSIILPNGAGIANVAPHLEGVSKQRQRVDLARALDRALIERVGTDDPIESAIENAELAFRMQSAVPELMEITGEPEALRDRYGLNSRFEPTRIYGRQCLLARRLVERGVRFIELTCPSVDGDRWDQHSNLKAGHENNARAVDQPIGALLDDLRSRGLLEDTLVVWGGEFGRTPFAQGRDGRDHNPFGFTVWLAGGGVKPGHVHGATDEFGYRAIDGTLEIHDLHATILHLLGMDHTRLTVLHGGREMRLTDVHGHVVRELLA